MEELQKKLLERIDDLEKWKKDILWKSAILIFAAVVACGLFGIKLSGVHDSINSTKSEIEALNSKLTGLRKLAAASATEANRALILVGDLEVAVASSQKASFDAAESSTNAKLTLQEIKDAVDSSVVSSRRAEASSKLALNSVNETKRLLRQINASVQKANDSANAAKVTAKVLEVNLREYDIAMSRAEEKVESIIKATYTQKPRIPQHNQRVIEVIIKGNGNEVTLKSGRSSLKTVTIAETGYTGVVYIPDGYTVLINVGGVGNDIYVTKPLQGRVSMHSKGIGNSLIE